MTGPVAIAVGAVAILRLAELAWSRRNTKRLLERGGIEHGASHYRWFVLLHGGWLAALILRVPLDTAPHGGLLIAFGLLQLLRLWIIVSLGPYWTTRVVTLPGAPLVARGPYRWCRHPNYAVVAAEIAVLPLAFGDWQMAIVFSALNAALLAHRIRVEAAALAERRKSASQG